MKNLSMDKYCPANVRICYVASKSVINPNRCEVLGIYCPNKEVEVNKSRIRCNFVRDRKFVFNMDICKHSAV